MQKDEEDVQVVGTEERQKSTYSSFSMSPTQKSIRCHTIFRHIEYLFEYALYILRYSFEQASSHAITIRLKIYFYHH